MELVKNKPRDPQQLPSASSPGMLGVAAAAPQDKSISPLPSSPMGHCQATHPGSSGSAAVGNQGWSLSWTQAEQRREPQTTTRIQKPPCTEPPAKPSPFALPAQGLETRGGYFHPSEASRHRAAMYHPSGSQNCGPPAPASLKAQPGALSFPSWEDPSRMLGSRN